MKLRRLCHLRLHYLSLPLLLVLLFPLGCSTAMNSTTPPAATAPGYLNSTDQTLGESLAAVNAFVNQEKANYAAEPPVQQGTEKPYLNALITATNTANTAYLAYHATPTAANLTAATNAVNSAQAAQAGLAKSKGVQ